jgi:hypothetical protein
MYAILKKFRRVTKRFVSATIKGKPSGPLKNITPQSAKPPPYFQSSLCFPLSQYTATSKSFRDSSEWINIVLLLTGRCKIRYELSAYKRQKVTRSNEVGKTPESAPVRNILAQSISEVL